MTKNMLANVNLDTLSNQQIMQMYVENVHPYLPLDVTYRGVNVQGTWTGGNQTTSSVRMNTYSSADPSYFGMTAHGDLA